LVEVNPGELFETVTEENGEHRERLRSIASMPRRIAQAISRIKLDPESGKVVDIVFHGKIEAAAVLLRSVAGINKTLLELTGKDGAPVQVENFNFDALTKEEIIQLESFMERLAKPPTLMQAGTSVSDHDSSQKSAGRLGDAPRPIRKQ